MRRFLSFGIIRKTDHPLDATDVVLLCALWWVLFATVAVVVSAVLS